MPQIKGLGWEKLLAPLQQKFAEWQAQDETGAGWGFTDVLALWRRKGLVIHEADLDTYHFPEEKWKSC